MKQFDQVIDFGENESYKDIKLDEVYFPNDYQDHSKLSSKVKTYNLNDLSVNNEVR